MATHRLRAAAAALALAVNPVWACSTCACGDYTITLMGAEKPFGGRFRAALDYAVRSELKGTRGQPDEQDLDEWRTSLGLSYSFGNGLTLAAQVPFVRKRVRNANLQEFETEGLGDMDLLLRWVAFRDQPATPRHLAGLRAGVRLPTSEEVEDAQGQVVDIDAQPDAGAAAPNLGLWYGYYAFPVFVSASAFYLFYGEGRQDFEPGDAAVASLVGQYALGQSVALQLGLDARHTDANRFSGVEDPHSGGFLAMGFAGGVLRFGPDFLIHAGVQVPLVEALDGEQEEKTGVRVGLAYDF